MAVTHVRIHNTHVKAFLTLSLCGSAALLLPLGSARVRAAATHETPPAYTLSLIPVADAPEPLPPLAGADAPEPGHCTVYVLEGPGRAASVFVTLDSVPMQEAMASLPRGASVECVGIPGLVPMPVSRQWDALAAFCRRHGLTFSYGNTD